MAAVLKKSMVECIDQYLNGQGWKWGHKDCIGLMFHILNEGTGANYIRDRYIPPMGYKESIKWLLTRFSDPIVPYMRLFKDANIHPTTDKTGRQIILVYGGRALTATTDGEMYPIHVVPGVIFQTDTGTTYALMRGGLKSVIIDETALDCIHRYIVPEFN